MEHSQSGTDQFCLLRTFFYGDSIYVLPKELQRCSWAYELRPHWLW